MAKQTRPPGLSSACRSARGRRRTRATAEDFTYHFDPAWIGVLEEAAASVRSQALRDAETIVIKDGDAPLQRKSRRTAAMAVCTPAILVFAPQCMGCLLFLMMTGGTTQIISRPPVGFLLGDADFHFADGSSVVRITLAICLVPAWPNHARQTSWHSRKSTICPIFALETTCRLPLKGKIEG
jgi:hypothetical protein